MDYSDRSEFNDAVGFLRRLDNYFRVANYYAESEQAHNWLNSLITIYRELFNFVKEDKEQEVIGLKNLVSNFNNELNRTGYSEGIAYELYWKLHNFHVFLKKVYGDSGLETKMLEDARKALN